MCYGSDSSATDDLLFLNLGKDARDEDNYKEGKKITRRSRRRKEKEEEENVC